MPTLVGYKVWHERDWGQSTPNQTLKLIYILPSTDLITLHSVSGELIILIQQSESEGNFSRIWQRTRTERKGGWATYPLYFPAFFFYFASGELFPFLGFMYICLVWFKALTCCATYEPHLQCVFFYNESNESDVNMWFSIYK